MKQKQERVSSTDAFLIAGGTVLAWEVPIIDSCPIPASCLKPASVPSCVLQALMWILPRTGPGLFGQVATTAVHLHARIVPQSCCNAAAIPGALCARCGELGSSSGHRRAPAEASSSSKAL